MIGARIDDSRREKLGRIHRLNCEALRLRPGGLAKRNVDRAPERRRSGQRI